MRAAALALAAGALLAASGCTPARNHPEPTAHYAQIDPATAGSIEGTIHFAGQAPEHMKIDMSSDPGCAAAGSATGYSEQYVIHDGRIANVFLYVKDGLGNKIYAASTTPAVLDQKGCHYVPHVIGVMAGQPVEFRNSDPTMHNINVQTTVAGNHDFNTGQAAGGKPVRYTFARPEEMIPVRCNLHPWMQAFINVAPNPFFAVSDDRGHYSIRGLPPGTYTLVADQEKLGIKEITIQVSAHHAAQADFTYSGSSTATAPK